ncbi:M16 family metallopeptidase [Candidatus Neomarinimicrobiota bacterium]
MKITAAIIVTALFMGCAGMAVAPPSSRNAELPRITPPEIRLSDQEASLFSLENGLEVLAIRNSSSPMVGLNLAIRVGSAYEDYSTSGMSHMLEHLLFNGTERRTQEELYDETDYYGAYSNAHTDIYFTNFMILLPAEFIVNGMDIQTDMIFNSTLPNTKFVKERGIVMEEIRKDRDREDYAVQNYLRRMNYGPTGPGLSTIGTLSTIEHLSREDTYRFYKNYYVPNNMILTIIGNFNPQDLKNMVEQYYGAYAPSPIPDPPAYKYMLNTGQINQAPTKASKIYGQVVFDAPPFDSPNELSYEVFTSLLNEELKDLSGSYSVSAQYVPYPNTGRLLIQFNTEPSAAIENIFTEIVTELVRIDDELVKIITDHRLALWAKQRSVEDYSLLDSPHYYGMMRATDLSLGGGAYVLSKLNAVNLLTSSAVIKDVQGFTRASHQFNLVYPESTGESSVAGSESALKKSTLQSGAVLVTSSGGGSKMFGMHILIKNRHVIEDSLEGGAEILHTLLESGTDRYSQEEIQDKLSSLGATLKVTDMGFIPYDDYYNQPDYGYIRFECLAEDAKEGIAFMAHLLDHTSLDQEKVGKAVSGARRRVGMQRGTARFTARKEFNTLLFSPGHPVARSVSGSMESITTIAHDNLQALKQGYFRPENYIISISSPIPHDTLEHIFNSIWTQSGTPVDRVVTPIPAPVAAQTKRVDMGKEQAQIRIGYTFLIDTADKPAFSLLTALLSSRMAFDLRETRGLAYTLGLSNGYDENSAWLIASMGTGTDNVSEATAGIKSYFNPKRLSDLAQREVDKTINARKGRYMRQNLTRIGQAYFMGYNEYMAGDYQQAVASQTMYDGLTVNDIRRVARKYLILPKNHTMVVVN